MKKKSWKKKILLTALVLLVIGVLSGMTASILVGKYPEMGKYLDRQISNSSFNVVTVINKVMHQDSFSFNDKVIATTMMIAMVLYIVCFGILLMPLALALVIVLVFGAVFGGGGDHISGDFTPD